MYYYEDDSDPEFDYDYSDIEDIDSTGLAICIIKRDEHFTEIKLKAIEYLIDTQAVDEVLNALDGEYGVCRGCLLFALANMKDPRVIGQLLKELDDPEPTVRFFALIALGATDYPKRVEILIDQLDHGHPSFKPAAIEGLGYTKSPEAFYPLVRMLKSNDEALVGCAIQALTELGDVRAVDYLVETMMRSSPHISSLCVEALGALRDPNAVQPLANFLQENKVDNSAIFSALIAIGKPAVSSLEELLQDTNNDIRELALLSLSEIHGERAAESIACVALNDPAPDIRELAQDTLVSLIGCNSISVLIKTLDDPDESVQLNALHQLGSLPGNDAVNILLDKMLHGDNPSIRISAFDALRNAVETEKIMTWVEPLLTDSDPEVLLHAAKILCLPKYRAEDKVVHALLRNIEILHDDKFTLNALSILTCCDSLPDPTSYYLFLCSNNLEIQMATIAILQRSKDERVVEPLIALLKSIPESQRTLDRIDSISNDNAHILTRHLLIALGYLEDRRAIDPIIQILLSGNADTWKETLWALYVIDKKMAVECLEPYRNQGHHVTLAINALKAPAFKYPVFWGKSPQKGLLNFATLRWEHLVT